MWKAGILRPRNEGLKHIHFHFMDHLGTGKTEKMGESVPTDRQDVQLAAKL